jgi:hypothetical protein
MSSNECPDKVNPKLGGENSCEDDHRGDGSVV